MATSAAIRSAGTQFKVRISGVYTLIPDARAGSGLGGEAPEFETTPIDETSTRHFLLDLPNPGEFSLQANFVPGNTVQTYLLNAYKNGTLEALQVIYSNGLITTFSAFVKNFERSFEAGKEVGAEIAFKITGAIVDP
jgi:hypothetical protein